MKKRIFVIFALLLVVLLLFASCDLSASSSDLQQINDMLKLDYSKVQILISTKSQGSEYKGKFTMTYGEDTTIEYEIERANTFEIGDDGSIVTPEDGFITNKKGTVVVRDGKIVDGDVDVELPELGVYVGGFSFKQAFFTNVSNKKAKFEADVTDPQNFTGNTSLVCKDMHVTVVRNINSNALTSIQLTYTSSNGSEVTINYVFTK